MSFLRSISLPPHKIIILNTYAISPSPLSLSKVIPTWTLKLLVDLIGTFRLKPEVVVFITLTLNSTVVVVCVSVTAK